MKRRFRGSRLNGAIAGTLFVGAVLYSEVSRARHTEEQRITDDTAYTLNKYQARVGLWKAQYAPFKNFHAGLYHWPWLFRVANLHAKWTFYADDPLSFATSLGFFYLDTSRFPKKEGQDSDAKVVFSVVPFDVITSYRFGDRFTLSGGVVYTVVKARGEGDPDVIEGFIEGGVDNLQLVSTLEWRVSEVTAFTLHGRYLLLQSADAITDSTFHPDDFTTVELVAAGSSNNLNFEKAGSVTPGVVFSWDVFNLRFGLSIGNYNVPAINFVLPTALVVPELDLYWVW